MSASLAIDALSKRYGETVALDGVSIEFEAGRIHTVLGENGSGKSTLVKLLSGIVRPDGGRVLLDGRDVTGLGPGPLRARGIGTVFQEVLVAPDRDAVENVLLGADSLWRYGVPRRARRDWVAAIFAEIGVPEMPLDRPTGGMPLAQQQLIVIARAIARDVRVLILDESTAALDHRDRDAVFAAVEGRAASGCAVIFISHRMDEVLRLSDSISVLRGGRLVRTIDRGEASRSLLLELTAPSRHKQHVEA